MRLLFAWLFNCRLQILGSAQKESDSVRRSAQVNSSQVLKRAETEVQESIKRLQFGGNNAAEAAAVAPDVRAAFNSVDQDGSGEIDVQELQRAMLNGNRTGFNERACTMMIGN